MKRAMEFHELAPIDDPRKVVSATLKVRGPGIIRQTSVIAKPFPLTSIIPAREHAPSHILAPVIIFEIDPDARPKNRSFSISPPGTVIECTNQIEYRGSFVYPQGAIFFLFEEIIPWVHPDDKGGKPLTYCRRCGKGVGFWSGPDEGPCKCTEDQMDDFMQANPTCLDNEQ